jgi:hypothetical protein
MKRKRIGYVIRSLSVFARTRVLEAWSKSMGAKGEWAALANFPRVPLHCR